MPPASEPPRAAIVIPVFRQPGLVIEALASALAEAERSNLKVVVVNDGCPFPETHEVCLSFATAHPDRLSYIRTANGGLSAARNRGIRHAFARHPGLEAIYLLDADNRLTAGAIDRALATMDRTGAAWVYGNIEKFGIEWNGDFGGPYSMLRHLFQNICDAGSLIHRRVFDAGVWFDEGMRRGYEDWEFWIRCAELGMRGAPCPEFGFRYRARRESMVRDSDRDGNEIVSYMQRKHKALYAWRNLLRLEHVEAPRFCILDPSTRDFALTSIAGEASSRGEWAALPRAFWGQHLYPARTHFPHHIAAIEHDLLVELDRLKLLDAVFWLVEDALNDHAWVRVVFEPAPSEISISPQSLDDDSDVLTAACHLAATTRERLLARIEGLDAEPVPGRVREIVVRAPFDAGLLDAVEPGSATEALATVTEDLAQSHFALEARDRWEWRDQSATIPGSRLAAMVRHHLQAMAPLARGAIDDRPQIALVLPVLSFGGVEQVGIQLAHQFRAAGWRTRAIVTERDRVQNLDMALAAFDSICFLDDDAFGSWRPSGKQYYGHAFQQWTVDGRHDRLIGLVADCTAVLMLQANHAYEVMGWLRRHGIATATSLHLLDRDLLAAPVGHPYLMLPYEHVFDLITAPSRQLLDFCAAAGVPEEKLVHLPNAPTFAADGARVAAKLSAIANGPPRPLRLLSIGRLDRQKGVERVEALARATRASDMAIEWRFIGGSVLETEAAALDETLVFEPPVYTRAEIVDRLLWADAIVLLSHWEGSPLIILEAQSLGTIPIATDVGAIAEMIEEGVDGFLIGNRDVDRVVGDAMGRIRELAGSPLLRATIARQAAARLAALNWERSATALIGRLAHLAGTQRPPR